jgi:YCII-related domain.
MEKWLYIMQLEKTKTYNKITKVVVAEHVENLRALDENGHIELCGVYKGYPNVAGMFVIKAESYEEADAICKAEPLVVLGHATYKLHALRVADKENNYLL